MADETHIPMWMMQAAGGVLFIFGLGKVYGTLVKNIKDQTDEIDKLKRTIDDLQSAFTTVNGEPKYITYRAHDVMQSNCQALISADIAHIKETLEDIKATVNRRRTARREDDT